MAFKLLRKTRYERLRAAYFTPLEARELSKLPQRTPALRLLIEERAARRERFEQIAASKIGRGKWRRSDIPLKWRNNLSRMYYKYGVRVKFGPTGRQQVMPKGSPNPWALYREALRRAPDKPDYESPWKNRRYRRMRIDEGMVVSLRERVKGRV